MVRVVPAEKSVRSRGAVNIGAALPVWLVVAAFVLAAPLDLCLLFYAVRSHLSLADLVAVVIVGAMLGLIVLAVSQLDTGIVAAFETPSYPREIRDDIVQLFGSQAWWVDGESDTELRYTIQRGPNVVAAICLALFGIIPGVVYLLVSRRVQVARVTWTSDLIGMNRVEVEITPQRPGGRELITQLYDRLDS